MNEDELYFGIGALLGTIVAFVTFIGSWIYCMSVYGFLFGFGLGWIPSIILAVMVGFAVKFLWGPAALLIAYGVYKAYA